MRRLLATVTALVLVGLVPAAGVARAEGSDAASSITASTARQAPKWKTTVYSRVPNPGHPAYVHAHTNGRVYAGTYTSGTRQRSRVFEWSGHGTLLRSWTVPGQRLGAEHGVQVANQTRDGLLVLLETSTRSVMTLDVTTGRFRTIARFPKGSIPNYATWGPGGGLFVTDYGKGVVWRVGRAGGVRAWFRSPKLEGILGFGTTGIAYRPGRRDLLITQQTLTDGTTLPTNGALFKLPVRGSGSHAKPGRLSTLWRSGPTDLPDGFGIGRSGHIYVAMAGLTQQLVELTAGGREVDRFPDVPLAGENGSSIPFDTPCSATFRGTKVLVANQSAIMGDASHMAILQVEVGERGRAPHLPRTARFSR